MTATNPLPGGTTNKAARRRSRAGFRRSGALRRPRFPRPGPLLTPDIPSREQPNAPNKVPGSCATETNIRIKKVGAALPCPFLGGGGR